MPDVVTFMLEPGACLPHGLQYCCNIAKGVAEDEIVRANDVILLPIMLPGGDPLGGGKHGEVYRPHVQGTHLGLEMNGSTQAFDKRHCRRAAGGDVDHGIGALLDDRKKPTINLWIAGWSAILWHSCVEVEDRGPRFGSGDALLCDLGGRARQDPQSASDEFSSPQMSHGPSYIEVGWITSMHSKGRIGPLCQEISAKFSKIPN